MEPPDALPPPPSPPIVDDADATALADVAAGRVVGSEAVVQWLGGWHLARLDRREAWHPTPTKPIARADDDYPSVALPASYPRSNRIYDGIGVQDIGVQGAVAAQDMLVWSDAAIAGCHRLRRLLAGYGAGADRRLAVALVAAMVELIVDGAGRPPGIDDVALLPPLALRVLVADGRVAVLGLRWAGCIT